MVVEELDQDLAPMAAAGRMSAALAARIYENHGLAWPVSGDKTAGEERHRDRRVRDRMLRTQGTKRLAMVSHTLTITGTVPCWHGPIVACRCTVTP